MKSCHTFLFILFVSALYCQERPKIFLDCRTYCDRTYIRTEIDFVDYMFDRQTADLYILLISQNTGGGGREFVMTVENKKAEAEPYEVKFYTEPIAVEAEIRSAIVKTLKNVLLKYMVDQGLMDQISYTVESNEEEEEVVEIDDPWNAWVFSAGVNGNLNMESQFNSLNLRFNVSANRITEKHKFRSFANYSRNESTFVVAEGEEDITNLQTTFFGNVLYVYSLTDHWSVGGIARYSRSIFENYDHSITVSPAIEYNIFPYSEVADRSFTFRYEIGGRYNDYIDSTIYFKEEESLLRHRLALDLQIVKPWGNIDFDAGYSQFLSLDGRYSIDVNPSIDVNLFKGFNFWTGVFYAITKDRINIPKGNLSVEEIIFNNKLRDSNFSFYAYFGIRYRFGSAHNNVVNPRF